MEGILEKFMRDAARNPDRPMYEFLDCGTDPFIHNTVTIGEAWQHAMDMAAELRQQGAKRAAEPSFFPCRIPEQSMPFGAA